AELTSTYWLNFVKTGDPNGPGSPHWPSCREPGERLLVIDAAPHVRAEDDRARHEFLASVARPIRG
ncbi:MAG TPA: hypothetical protein VEF36_00395, partial [Roseiarcus sp.]|nr:hypothetical protein [Roseiarcus sp.]